MANEETRKLPLVEETIVQTGLWGYTITPSLGFSKEVFREGRHIGSVRDAAESSSISAESSESLSQLKARNKDKFLTINLGPCLLLLKGSFYTSDGFMASYEVHLELRVNNPSRFAQRYLQQSDPVGLLKSAILQEFDAYAARTTHDGMNSAKLRHDARFNVQSNKVGIVVAEVYKSAIYADPRRATIHEIEKDAEVEKTKINTTSELDLLRDKLTAILTSQQKRNERSESSLDQEHQLREQMKAALAGKMSALLLNELDNMADSGLTVSEIIQNPLLLNLVAPLFTDSPSLSLSSGASNLLEGGTKVKQENPSLQPKTPPKTDNVPQMPIPESDAGEYREIEDDDDDDDE